MLFTEVKLYGKILDLLCAICKARFFVRWLHLLPIQFLLTLVQPETAFCPENLTPSLVQSFFHFSLTSHDSASSHGLILDPKEASCARSCGVYQLFFARRQLRLKIAGS